MVTQTDLLADALAEADLGRPVVTCPGWTVRQLARHVGGGHRWVEEIVRTRAAAPIADDGVRDVASYPDDGAATIAAWLRDGAALLAATLRDGGPGLDVWTPVPGCDGDFWPRRLAHETLVHRADAELALDRTFTTEPDLAADAIDEWMELASLPTMLEVKPEQRELIGPGRTIHLHATDAPAGLDAEWVVDLTGDVIVWRPSHEKSAVAWRGPLTDLLLGLYRRVPPRAGDLEVLGDADLLDLFLSRVGFGVTPSSRTCLVDGDKSVS
ncbi:MAG: maleylpyruvate isomerase family mycothiol-dependent enzyme [Ilumatobacteraceae bacterium]